MGLTIKDIAKEAKVSTATVSNALTGKKYVSEDLAQRVYDAVQTMGYSPNVYARGLKTNRSYTIGVQIPDVTNPYFGSAVKVIQEETEKKGYSIILYNTDNVLESEIHNLANMINVRVDGIINVAPRQKVKVLTERVNVPMVIMDRLPTEIEKNVAFVYSDSYAGAAAVAEYALGKDYRHFAYLAGPANLVSNASERLRGFVETLERHEVPKKNCRIYYGELTFECGYELMNTSLNDGLPSDGHTLVFLGNDLMAWGAMEALKERNIKIPRDIGVIGYDNVFFSKFLYPALTTVENPIQEMARESVALLLDAIDNKRELRDVAVMIKGKLIKRLSC